MDYKIEVVTLAVSDVDKSLEFYTRQAGFALDVDYHPADGFLVSPHQAAPGIARPGSSARRRASPETASFDDVAARLSP